MITSLNPLIDLAAEFGQDDPLQLDCNFDIKVDGHVCHVYDCSIVTRDILLFTDLGTVTVLVDSYGNRNVGEIFDWELDKSSGEVSHD